MELQRTSTNAGAQLQQSGEEHGRRQVHVDLAATRQAFTQYCTSQTSRTRPSQTADPAVRDSTQGLSGAAPQEPQVHSQGALQASQGAAASRIPIHADAAHKLLRCVQVPPIVLLLHLILCKSACMLHRILYQDLQMRGPCKGYICVSQTTLCATQ